MIAKQNGIYFTPEVGYSSTTSCMGAVNIYDTKACGNSGCHLCATVHAIVESLLKIGNK